MAASARTSASDAATRRRTLAGVDVGATKIQVAIVDGHFAVLGESRAPTPETGGPPAVLATITELLDQAKRLAGVTRLVGVGVGTPGAVDGETGVVAHSPNIAGWEKPFPLGPELAKRCGAPVVIDNDVRAGMTGEHRLGAGRPFSDLLGVWFGSGVGGAVILGGALRRGTRGSCGEIGHVVVKRGGRRCGCGRRGCFEAYAGRVSMVKRARALERRGRHTDLFTLMERGGRDRVTSAVIAKALKASDRVTVDLIDEAVAAAGVALASAVNLLDIEAVVVGGGLGTRLGAPFVKRIGEAMEPHLLATGPGRVRLVPAELGDLAGALGAAVLADALDRAQAAAPGRRARGGAT